MNFDLSDEQRLLQDTVRQFLEGECPLTHVRAVFEGEGHDPTLWKGLAELGVAVRGGRLHLGPTRAHAVEFLEESGSLSLVAAGGDEVTVPLSPGTLGISCFQVPVVLHRGGAPRVVLTDASGTTTEIEGHVLDEATSAGLFARATGLQRIDVFGR